ncbi:MAG TPA: hypothetical protein VH988_28940 [Thermoanaerobaculia bacterium]|jgi:hypothetical protein|nr:hypothetical protein [Thermoanaerobaculia bacterium]
MDDEREAVDAPDLAMQHRDLLTSLLLHQCWHGLPSGPAQYRPHLLQRPLPQGWCERSRRVGGELSREVALE